jgi:type VII secretion protein EccB
MHTRRDQLKAYRFLTRRMNVALLAFDPNAPEQPIRRLARTAVASAAVAVLAVAAAAVIGLIVPGHATSWRDGRSLVVEKETGTRFVYVGGVLHPVLNWASAKLVLGTASPPVARVSATSLAGAARGLPVGIPGAPEELPSAAALRSGPWVLCSQPAPTSQGTSRPAAELTIGLPPPGAALADDQGLLVSGSDRTTYLIWQGQRLRITAPFVTNALGMAALTPVPVGAALLNTVPQGPDLGPVAVDGLGSPGPPVAGNRAVVGQVYVVTAAGGNEQYYLLGADGLRPLTPLRAAIQLGDPREAGAYPGGAVRAIPLSSADLTLLRTNPAADQGTELPAQAPRPVSVVPEQVQLCAAYGAGGATAARAVKLLVRTADPVTTTVPATEPVDSTGEPLADVAVLAPGTGALVSGRSSPGAGNGAVYLVTDLGVRYPVAGTDALSALGYQGVAPAPVPAAFVQLLRTGPTLSTAEARQEQPVTPVPAASGQ